MRKKPPTALLQYWYYEEKLTFAQIADRCGAHPSSVGAWFKTEGLQPRHGPAAQRQFRRVPFPSELRRLYLEEGATADQIAERVGAGRRTVRKRIHQQGLQKRKPVAIAELRRLYLEEGLTSDEIGARLGVDGSSIRGRLRRAGVPMRTRGPKPRIQTVAAIQTQAAPARSSVSPRVVSNDDRQNPAPNSSRSTP